jgi:hypothetical protein
MPGRVVYWGGDPDRRRTFAALVVTASGAPSFAIPPSVLYRDVEGQMVLLNLESEQYFGLNQVGAHILRKLIEQPLDVAIRSLTADFDKADPDVLRRDVHNLIKALIDAGLLEPVNSD